MALNLFKRLVEAVELAWEQVDQNWANIETEVNGKAPINHTHPISDITGLQLLLDAQKVRVVQNGQTLTVAKETERQYAQNLYNKGVIVVEDALPYNYESGMDVPRYGILRVDGLLSNENTIINDGLIINN